MIIWGSFDNPQVVFHTLSDNPLFDYTQLINPEHPEFWGTISLALYFLIPSFNPAIFQRASMAKNTVQLSDAFFFATFARLAISILFFWVAILLLSKDSTLEPNKLFAYIIDKYAYVGFKGFLAAGIMAMVMSTADSYINAATVTLSYDIRKSFGINWSEKRSLIFSYVCAVFIGILAFALAFYIEGLLALFLLVSSFYLPVVTVPFLLAIFGFRTSPKAVLSGIISGLVAVLFWRTYITGINSVLPGMIANIIVLFTTHYALNQPGGWVGIKDPSELNRLKQKRKEKVVRLIDKIRNFDIIVFCHNNAPKQESVYTLFAIFCIVSVFSTMYSMPISIRQQYTFIVELIYHSVLIISAVFLTYPVWPQTFKNKTFIAIAWVLCLFYVLIFIGFLQVLISKFGQFQLMIFLLSTIILTVITRWQITLFMLLTGVISSIIYFKWNTETNLVDINLGIKFKITYLLLLISSILLIIFKPKQQQQEATEEKAEHLAHEIIDLKKENECARREIDNLAQGIEFLEEHFEQKKGKLKAKELYLRDQLKLMRTEVAKVKEMKDEFIRNVPHETNTPMTAILSLSEVLYSYYDSLDEDKIKQSLQGIVNGGERLKSYINNITDLSRLSSLSYDLDLKQVNLSQLIKDRTILYKKVFSDDTKKQDFKFDIDKNIMMKCDEYYIRQAIDNLISNANKYGEGKPIKISLHKKEDDNIEFAIADKGIGIPQDELMSIFDKFTVSSKTRTPAEGRGVGLALCEKIIKIHKGKIWAESDGNNGAVFYFLIPAK